MSVLWRGALRRAPGWAGYESLCLHSGHHSPLPEPLFPTDSLSAQCTVIFLRFFFSLPLPPFVPAVAVLHQKLLTSVQSVEAGLTTVPSLVENTLFSSGTGAFLVPSLTFYTVAKGIFPKGRTG